MIVVSRFATQIVKTHDLMLDYMKNSKKTKIFACGQKIKDLTL